MNASPRGSTRSSTSSRVASSMRSASATRSSGRPPRTATSAARPTRTAPTAPACDSFRGRTAARSTISKPQSRYERVSGNMIEVKVQSLGLDRTSNTPVVILQEKDGTRVLPIWIGPGEASAIAMELAGMKFSRPLTHDLFTSVIKGLGGQLRRVMITKVVDNTYYAELIVQRGNETISIDARPSDSIAIALRTEATIFTTEDLLENTSIEIADSTSSPEDFVTDAGEEGETNVGGLSPEELREYLRRMNPEDFGRFNP